MPRRAGDFGLTRPLGLLGSSGDWWSAPELVTPILLCALLVTDCALPW